MLQTQHREKITLGLRCFFAGLTLVCAVSATHQVCAVLAAAQPAASILFENGLSIPRMNAPGNWTNEYCGTCHKDAFETWQSSRHAVSGSTHNFEVEVLEHGGGRQQHCINCHTPRALAAGRLPTEEPVGLDEAYAASAAWIQQGVDCIACHVRDGHVLVTKHSALALAAHPIRVAPELGSAEFCGGCHQFSFKSSVLPDGYFGQLQQSSFEEFLQYRDHTGETDCLGCHMPGGSHAMPGGYDDEMLRSALDLELKASFQGSKQTSVEVEVEVSSGYVGHRIPGGEHFRFLSTETVLRDANGREVWAAPKVEEMRREMDAFEQGDPNATPIPDTRLKPGETREFKYYASSDGRVWDLPLSVEVSLWYHLMPIAKAQAMKHKPDTVRRIVLSESIELH